MPEHTPHNLPVLHPSLQAYRDTLVHYPPLPSNEERVHGVIMHNRTRSGELTPAGINARNTLVCHNQHLVIEAAALMLRALPELEQSADDLVQAGNLSLLRRVRIFRPNFDRRVSDCVRPYIRKDVHEWAEREMQQGHAHQLPLDVLDDAAEPVSPLDTIVDNGYAQYIWDNARLSPLQRDVIEMVCSQGLQQKDAAQELGVPPQSATRSFFIGLGNIARYSKPYRANGGPITSSL